MSIYKEAKKHPIQAVVDHGCFLKHSKAKKKHPFSAFTDHDRFVKHRKANFKETKEHPISAYVHNGYLSKKPQSIHFQHFKKMDIWAKASKFQHLYGYANK